MKNEERNFNCNQLTGDKNGAPRPRQMGPRKPAEVADRGCPKCGAPMIKRLSSKGNFFGCSKYPNCMHTENIK